MNGKALARAEQISKQYGLLNKAGKRSVLKELAAFGFVSNDLHVITGASMWLIEDVQGDDYDAWGSLAKPWNIKTLDALVLLAGRYEMDKYISPVLLFNIVRNGTPLRSVARLTGIPIDELRII